MASQPNQNPKNNQAAIGAKTDNAKLYALLAWSVLRQWWKIVIPAGLLLAAVAAAMVYLDFEPVYEAKALVRIEDHEPYLVQPDKQAGAAFVANQLGLIRSTLVLSSVASQPDIAALPELAGAQDPVESLGEMVSVTRAFGTVYYHIKFESTNPNNAAKVVNAITESYMKLGASLETERVEQLVARLEDEADKQEEIVEQLRGEVQLRTKEQLGHDPFAAQPGLEETQLQLHPLAGLQSQLTDIGVEQAVARAQIEALKSEIQELEEGASSDATAKFVTDTAVLQRVPMDPAVRSQVATIADMRNRLANLENRVDDPESHRPYAARIDQLVEQDSSLVVRVRELDQKKADLSQLRRTPIDENLIRDLIDQDGSVVELTLSIDAIRSWIEQVDATSANPPAHPGYTIRKDRLVSLEEELEELRESLHGRVRTTVEKMVVDQRNALQEEILKEEGLLVELRKELRGKARQTVVESIHDDRFALIDQIELAEARLERIRDDAALRIRAEMDSSITNERREQIATRRRQILDLERRLRDFAVRQTELESDLEEKVSKIADLSGTTLDLEIQRAELDRANEVLDRIAQRAFLLRTEQRAPDRVNLEQRAAVPVQPVEAVPFKSIFVVAGGAFLVPFGLALLWELRSRRVNDSEQLEHLYRLNVIGEIASLPESGGRKTEARSRQFNRQLRLFEESVDSLRACLVLSRPLKEVQVLAVSSAASSEGKTTVAAQLAISMARASGAPTLLIDGDMRSPDVHGIFEIECDPGLAEVLDNDQSEYLTPSIVRSRVDQLDVLPAGRLQKNPHRLLGEDRFETIIHEARKKYRHIIIDTPPVLAAGESLNMTRAADATIICTMRDTSRQDQVRKTHDRLVSSGANVIGCVFSGVPVSKYNYTYGYYDYGK